MFIGLSKVETQNHISLMWPSTRHNWCPGFASDYLRWLLVMFSMSACLQRFCHRVFLYHLPAQVHHPLSACEQKGQKYCPVNSNSFSRGPWASCLKKRHSRPSLKTVDIFLYSWIGPVIWNLRLKSLCMQRFIQSKSQKSRQLNLHLTHRCLQAGHTFEPKKVVGPVTWIKPWFSIPVGRST